MCSSKVVGIFSGWGVVVKLVNARSLIVSNDQRFVVSLCRIRGDGVCDCKGSGL